MLRSLEGLANERAGHPVIGELRRSAQERLDGAIRYRNAYANYCWDIASVADIRVAPFHLLASEGKVHVDRDHTWHMQTLARLAPFSDGLAIATKHQIVALDDQASRRDVIEWWEAMTSNGGEGMVVKPLDLVARDRKGLLQPAIKCRGREYLRIIYGPEYDRPENLVRLRERGLSTKRGLALREFALGLESLQRFLDRKPLRAVHECVFGVLALESDPVDPRL
jgi:protein phosphatase